MYQFTSDLIVSTKFSRKFTTSRAARIAAYFKAVNDRRFRVSTVHGRGRAVEQGDANLESVKYIAKRGCRPDGEAEATAKR